MRRIFVIAGLLVFVGLGLFFLSNMTGGVISGVHYEVVNESYVDGQINKTMEGLNGTQNISESG
jgi:hypothetical protein